MKKYLLLLHEDVQQLQALSPKEMGEIVQAHMLWTEQLAQSGNLIAGEGLEEKSVLITGKEAVVKDGTFLEAKEMIGGFYYLQANNMDEVIALAKSCPCHLWGGTTEIRPIMEYES
ncbi:MAG: YciI family protein [Bacteroidota bacterium]